MVKTGQVLSGTAYINAFMYIHYTYYSTALALQHCNVFTLSGQS